MSSLVIEPHYLGSIEYYCLIQHYDSVIFQIHDRFRKQTYRNRCYILSSNNVLPLVVPVSFSGETITKEVTIDYSQRWIKDHWGAFYSCYGKAPFFEFFADDLHQVWNKKHKYLVDLATEFIFLTCRLMQLNVKMTLNRSVAEKTEIDFCNRILPKKTFVDRKIYRPIAYSQLFGDTFIPNLSIIDLIMCEGPQAPGFISASFLKT